VKANGIIDLDEFKKKLKPETVLVSIMGVNNEIGVIQPLKEIGKV
jgi:cysteine desulfurase